MSALTPKTKLKNPQKTEALQPLVEKHLEHQIYVLERQL